MADRKYEKIPNVEKNLPLQYRCKYCGGDISDDLGIFVVHEEKCRQKAEGIKVGDVESAVHKKLMLNSKGLTDKL